MIAGRSCFMRWGRKSAEDAPALEVDRDLIVRGAPLRVLADPCRRWIPALFTSTLTAGIPSWPPKSRTRSFSFARSQVRVTSPG